MAASTKSVENSSKTLKKNSYDRVKVTSQPSAPNGAPDHVNADQYEKNSAPTSNESIYDDKIEKEESKKATAISELRLLQSYNEPGRDWAMTLVHKDAVQEVDQSIKRLKALRERELAAAVPLLAQIEGKKKGCVVM